MENWKERLRATLARNIAGLKHLDEARRATLLESEFLQVVEATEAGLPLGAAPDFPTAESESPDDEFEDVAVQDSRALARSRQRRAVAAAAWLGKNPVGQKP